MLDNTFLFKIAKYKVNWLTQRQRVLAQNIANSDTPNYLSRDLAPLDFASALRREDNNHGRLIITDNQHFQSVKSVDNFPTKVNRVDRFDRTINDNNVVLEEEVVKSNQTNMEHSMIIELLKKYMKMYKISLGIGK